MKATFEAQNPGEIEFTLTMTMPLRMWSSIREEISSGQYPCRELWKAIMDMENQARKVYTPETKE